jgi:hypothetical protein
MPPPFDDFVEPQSTSVGQIVLFVAVAALIVWLLIHLIRQRYNIRIVVRDGHVDVAGSLAARRAALQAFFTEWLPTVKFAKLYGHWDGRRLSLYGSGLTRGQFQQLRNYLTTEL